MYKSSMPRRREPIDIADVLSAHARVRPGQDFLVETETGERWTYGEMEAAACGLERELAARGVGAGDRVAAILPNVAEFFVLLFAAARRGAILVPIDPALKEPEADRLLAHCAPQAVYAAASLRRRFAQALRARRWSPVDRAFRRRCRLARPAARLAKRASGDRPCAIFYTSGTTGEPKGVVHANRMVLEKMRAFAERFGLDPSHRSLCLIPLHFQYSWNTELPTLWAGGTILLSPAFGAGTLGRLWELIDRHGARSFNAVPAILRALLQHPEGFKRSRAARCRFVNSAAAFLPVELLEAFERRFGIPVLECYGITETGFVTTVLPLSSERRAAGSVGRPLACEVRVLAGTGAAGEIAVRGNLMRGYYKRPDLTRRAVRAGWFRTGDIGRLDAQGRLYLLGRSKDVINRGGLKVYPSEIDEVLCRHRRVREAATWGAKDGFLGELVVSAVALKGRLKADPGALREHCRRTLADFKCPQRIHIVDAIPKTSRGKIDKKALALQVGESIA